MRTDDPPALHVVVELPGVDPAELQVVAADRVLVVAGVRRGQPLRGPLPADGDRLRALPAPDRAREPVDTNAATARYERGMLTVVLPIATKARHVERVVITIARRRCERAQFDEPFEPTDVEIPSALPVLPLKETVVFPQSVSPLAIGQERSIELVDDVVAGERAARARDRRRTRDAEPPGLGRSLRGRHRGDRPQDDPRARRDAADPRPGHRAHAGSSAGVQDEPYLVGEFAELPGRARGDAASSRR